MTRLITSLSIFVIFAVFWTGIWQWLNLTIESSNERIVLTKCFNVFVILTKIEYFLEPQNRFFVLYYISNPLFDEIFIRKNNFFFHFLWIYGKKKQASLVTGLTKDDLPQPVACGPFINLDIYGGEETQITDFPWLVQLGYEDRKYDNFLFVK